MRKKNKIVELIIMVLLFGFIGIFSGVKSFQTKVINRIKYEEKGNINYKVYLSDIKYYNKSFLDEGMQYISSIIDYIDINTNYEAKFDQNINSTGKLRAEAQVKILDKNDNNKVIYQNIENLKVKPINEENTNNVFVSDDIRIDYQKYNKLTNEFKTNYGISAECKLIINYYIDYISENEMFKKIDNNRIMTMEIPLSEQMINITKTKNINNTSDYTEETNKSAYNILLLIISLFFLVITIILIVKIVRIMNKMKKEDSIYKKQVRKILRQYDAYITETKENINLEGKTIIIISNFKELLDVRNNIEKTIIYTKDSEKQCRFILIDENEAYVYTLIDEQ